MLTARLTAVLLAFICCSCSGTSPGFPVDELDFAEVRSGAGWRLRIHGDGSASLRHKTLPAHYLHYPVGTFDVRPARRLSRTCAETTASKACVTLRYYTAFTDEEMECPCAAGSWPAGIIAEAIGKMGIAEEGAGSRVSRRMLSRIGR